MERSQSGGMKASVKKKCLNVFLKVDSLLHKNTSTGKLLHVTGAAYENERLANSVFVHGTVSSGRAAESVWRVTACRTRCSFR